MSLSKVAGQLQGSRPLGSIVIREGGEFFAAQGNNARL
jgi:hypothetical protein